jgi:hypothetical protein
MKISEAFQKAIDEKIPRIERADTDGKGFCARGLLLEYHIDPEPLSVAIRDKYGNTGGVVMANDSLHWTWKQFRNYARKHGL